MVAFEIKVFWCAYIPRIYIFYLKYNCALSAIKCILGDKHILCKFLGTPDRPVWSSRGRPLSNHTLCDAIFVDDEAIVVMHRSPSTLLEHLRTVVETVHRTFDKFALTLNFSAGKTEAILALRGKGSRYAKERLSNDMSADGAYLLPITLSWISTTQWSLLHGRRDPIDSRESMPVLLIPWNRQGTPTQEIMTTG